MLPPGHNLKEGRRRNGTEIEGEPGTEAEGTTVCSEL